MRVAVQSLHCVSHALDHVCGAVRVAEHLLQDVSQLSVYVCATEVVRVTVQPLHCASQSLDHVCGAVRVAEHTLQDVSQLSVYV